MFMKQSKKWHPSPIPLLLSGVLLMAVVVQRKKWCCVATLCRSRRYCALVKDWNSACRLALEKPLPRTIQGFRVEIPPL